MVTLRRDTAISQMQDGDDLEEEPGEVIESKPPLKVGEERVMGTLGFKKKLIKSGHGWDTPEFGDEVTVHYVGTLLDGSKFDSSRDRGVPFTFKLGEGQLVIGLDHVVVTMKKGEVALFTLPPHMGFGRNGPVKVPPNATVRFEVELLSWIVVVDICKDGGIIKKVLSKGERDGQPGDLDEVTVKYQVTLVDGTIVAKTPEEGVEFCVNDGHFCPALPKVLRTMKRRERVALIIQPQYAFGERGIDAQNGFPAIPSNSVLHVDLELVSFKPVIDVTGDSEVLKKILIEGEGAQTANEGAAVTVRYTAKLEDGTVFEKRGFDGTELLEFIVDEEHVISGLDRAAATMKKGEQSVVTVKPKYGYGSTEVKLDLATVPPCSTVIYEVEMVDFTKEKTPWEMNNHEKIEAAEKMKEEGNTLYKCGKNQRAAKKYDKASDYVAEDGSFGEDQENLVKALRVSCWLNHAACSLKLNNFQDAIKLCSKVLDVEFLNVKALYRRAQAYMETADYDLSELDIKKALEIDSQNREVKLLHKTIKQVQSESNRREAKLYTNMFASRKNNSAAKRLKVEKAEDEKSYGGVVASEMDKVTLTSGQHSDELVFDSC